LRSSRFREGRTELFVPEASLGPIPLTSPVFFNPAASINRDVSVATVDASEGGSFCDALAGVGARGVRVAKEVRRKTEVTLVDFNRESLALGRKSARLNGVLARCEFVAAEANSYLYSRYGRDEKFDFVDVDPFGTPVPFLQAALRSTKDGGIASITATDTAVLCGVHREVALRRYGGLPLNNHFHHETGIRLLLNAIGREAASLDLGVSPVAAHSTRHYIRVFVRVEAGPSKAEATRKQEGYVVWCPMCGNVSAEQAARAYCPECGSKVKSAGPLWLGNVTDQTLVAKARASAEKAGMRAAASILATLKGVDGLPQWSFSIERICSALGVATVPESAVVEALSGAGFAWARQPFEKTGIKTDGRYQDVVKAVRVAAS
jgi:tRNA (guanine26-N2/guanine27-N2)-dimethyltransferase